MSCDCANYAEKQVAFGDASTDASIEQYKRRKRQHVLFICTDLIRRPRAKYVVDAAVALKGFGHKITFVTSTNTTGLYQHDLSLFRVVEIGKWIPTGISCYLESTFYLLRSIYITIWFSMIFKNMAPKPSVVFVEANYTSVPILKAFTDCKVIYFQYKFSLSKLHLPASDVKLRNNWLVRQSLLNADDILVPNRVFYKIFRRSFGSGSKIMPLVCHPYIDIRLLKKIPPMPLNDVFCNLDEDCFVYLVLGEYHKRSNFELALDAFYLMLHSVQHRLHRRMHLVFSGHCGRRRTDHQNYYRHIKNKVTDMNMTDYVTFARRYGKDFKKTLLLYAVAVVDPVVDGLFNRYLLEAMALGKPIIATETGFARETLFHGVTGLLMPPTAEHFAAAMTELLYNDAKNQFLCKMAHCEFLRTYSFEAYGYRLNQIVYKHCKEKGR